MIVFEARNAYELLASCILGKRLISGKSSDRITILAVNLGGGLNYKAIEEQGITVIPINASRSTLAFKIALCMLNGPRRIWHLKDVFLFHEISPLVLFKMLGKKVNLVEHGEINYTNVFDAYSNLSSRHPYVLMKRIFNQSFVGEGAIFSHIYLKDPSAAPTAIRSKVLSLNLAHDYDSMTFSDRQALASLFRCDLAPASPQPSRIIITQPFSEISIMSEDRKIAMYRSISSEASGNLYIKPHPKETTDYGLEFPDATILEKNVPFELLWLSSLRNSYIYTVNSSVGRMPGMNVFYFGDTLLNEYRN